MLTRVSFIVQAFALVGVVGATFGGALDQVDFLSDDWDWQYASQLGWMAIAAPIQTHHYTPVFLAVWKATALIGDGQPSAFALLGLALHACNGLLLSSLARQLGASTGESFLIGGDLGRALQTLQEGLASSEHRDFVNLLEDRGKRQNLSS